MNTHSRNRQRRGFALVVTLSLMILLTILAVGLLTLSSVSLRTTGQGQAMATARANARLALMLALGELQKSAGPDQRVTARADIVDENIANPRLTGVWKSWKIDASATPTNYTKATRDDKFVSWLVSGTDPALTGAALLPFASGALASPVKLWDIGSLGATAVTDKNVVQATKVLIRGTPATAPAPGAYAWAVLDEGVKVRVNTRYADDATTKGMQTAELGAGERPGVEFIPGLEKLDRSYFKKGSAESATIDKGITRLNFSLAGENLAPGTRELLKPLTHDVSSQSIGLFTDTANGGLKQDFHMLMNGALPAEYVGKGVYSSRLAMTAATAPSDPTWASLRDFSLIYRDTITNVAGQPVLKPKAPVGWVAATTTGTPSSTTLNPAPPPGVLLMPTIAKVQVLFSLIGRDLYRNLPNGQILRELTALEKDMDTNNDGVADTGQHVSLHGPQDLHFTHTQYDYDLHLLYEPMVTLHNPYNVALEFTNLRVEFIHIPFAMKVYRNGIAQSNDFAPLETMYGDNRNGAKDKTFGMNLKTKSNGIPGTPTFRLMPGEVKMFSPYIDPSRSYYQDVTNAGGSRVFWDIYVHQDDTANNMSKTANIDAIPGWRGDGIGFDCDNICGNYPVNGTATEGHWSAGLGIAWNDKISVEFQPTNIARANNKFVVQMTANVNGGSTPTVISAIEMDFEKPTGLNEFMANNGATMPLRYPKINDVPNYVYGYQLVDRATQPIGAIMNAKAFALLSAQAKSTSGGRDVSIIDGRLATKPWSFGHGNIGASTQKVLAEHCANASHEFDLQVLPGDPDGFIDGSIVTADRGNFISGQTGYHGTSFGAQYDIPLAPLQTLASLNGANPGGSSGYLPRFAQPIGNSWAHPFIPATQATQGIYLDHSFLLNAALYDSYYFSGLADQTGPFGSATNTSAKLAAGYAAGDSLNDPRLVLHPPDGKTASSFAAEAATATAYSNMAAWQIMEGAFNINSTSVPAWKAMLASIHDQDALFNQLNKAGNSAALSALPVPSAGKKTRISRFRLPASQSVADGGDPKDAFWLGTREYSDAELLTLATHIVQQVRARGPFLSMAEFVNRRLGSDGDDKAQRGALQQAIDDSNLNAALATTADAGFDIPSAKVSTYKYKNAAAGAGSSYQGAPGFLTQADLLNVLGNAATPRSDTFTIRGYGESRDKTGNIIVAQAFCEAVVQRNPEWLDPADAAATPMATLASTANRTFGRRFLITSLRWLGPNEI